LKIDSFEVFDLKKFKKL